MSPICLRLNVARRAVRELTAIAEKRAAEAAKSRATSTFRPLSEAEAKTIVGDELLAKLTRFKRSAALIKITEHHLKFS